LRHDAALVGCRYLAIDDEAVPDLGQAVEGGG
jgi:hypothetical protein